MTPEELIKQREQRKLLAAAAQAKSTTQTDAEKIISDAAKENLKTAGRLAASLGKTLADKTKQAAAVAADKGREAQESLVRRAEEAKARRDAEAAEQARLEGERTRERAEQMPIAQPEARAVETVSAQPEPMLTTAAPLVVEAAPTPAEEPEATSATDIDAVISTLGSDVQKGEQPAPPEQAPVEPKAPEVQEAASSNPTQPPVSAFKTMPTQATAKPQASQAKSGASSYAVSAVASNKQGWQRLAGASVAVLLLGGTLAWWATHRSPENALGPQADAATVVKAPKRPPVPAALVPSAPPKAEAIQPVIAPREEKSRMAASVSEVPKAAMPPKVEVASAAPPVTPAPVAKADTTPASKPKPRSTSKPAPKTEPKNDWQDQANSDIDAWAEKIK